MNAIRSLMKCIFSLNIVVYFSNARTITSCYDCCFIILIIIFSQWLLRTNKKRIFAIFHRLVRIAITSTNIRDFAECLPEEFNCPPPADIKCQ